jgi:serine acetyltransferase
MDWSVNNSSISKLVLLVHRLGHLVVSGSVPVLLAPPLWALYRFLDLVWMKLLAGAEIPHDACIGPGLLLAHGARGVVIGNRVVIGEQVSIYHQVSIGGVDTEPGIAEIPVPIIADRVRVGTGARVLGNIRIGEGAMIGAGAVVVTDVPAGKTAAGNPGRILY